MKSIVPRSIMCLVFSTVCSQAHELTEESAIRDRIRYVTGVAFEFFYRKDLYELELRHHGDREPTSPVMKEAQDNLDLWERHYREMLQKTIDDRIKIEEDKLNRILQSECQIMSGSRLIALFDYTRLVSPRSASHLRDFFMQLNREYENSSSDWRQRLWMSWTNNSIWIPSVVKGSEIKWKKATPYEYIAAANCVESRKIEGK